MDSRVIKPDLITNEVFVIWPQIKQTELLYRMNRDGCTPEVFHKLCDNRGATMLLVKANNGYVFGGYNPTSWFSQYCYSDCDDAFLFSLVDPTLPIRPPLKFPVLKSKSHMAIKQSECQYSPGFGEANQCDLFIAFKNLKKSYSKLGNVY